MRVFSGIREGGVSTWRTDVQGMLLDDIDPPKLLVCRWIVRNGAELYIEPRIEVLRAKFCQKWLRLSDGIYVLNILIEQVPYCDRKLQISTNTI
jgi:hypothetical protein